MGLLHLRQVVERLPEESRGQEILSVPVYCLLYDIALELFSAIELQVSSQHADNNLNSVTH